MFQSISILRCTIPLLLLTMAADVYGQQSPYDVFPPAAPPYYRVRYEASAQKGELVYPVNYTIWIPKGVKALRGVIVHQHGCGEGSCKSGLTGAYDLHWQALAKKHDCALLAPSYEQPDKADCQMWCDPRNGSSAAFQKCLVDLGAKSGHPELAKIPWALWGHSGGGHWAGGMVMLHPERIAAAWLRSGVPLLKEDPKRTTIKAHTLPDAALKVPVMCNLGTKEGVSVKDRFAGVWTANETFFNELRSKGGLICVSIDPLSSHDCGNQRYLAIPWLDACLNVRLAKVSGDSLHAMPSDREWLAPIMGGEAIRAAKFTGDPLKAAWLPNEVVAKAWMQYVKDTNVADSTPPPAPTNLHLKGNELTWEAEADLESGLANFIIERDGKFLAKVPEQAKNPFGRPIFQNLQYSDTPTQPLVPMRYTDAKAEPGKKHIYEVIAVNTVGLTSKPGAAAALADAPEGFMSMFNSKDLTGWDGSPTYWKVENGILTGTTDGTLKYNRFIVWRGGKVKNFEWRVKVRVSPGGNSGLQYRSVERPDLGESVVVGYQCDVVSNRPDYNGMLYEERGRRILAHTGEKVIIDAAGQPWVVDKLEVKEFKAGEWHDFRILVEGNRHRHWIDGHLTVDVIDLDEKGRKLEGILGMQVHVGPKMTIEYKDVYLKKLADDLPVISAAQAPIPTAAIKVVPQGKGSKKK